ncbi:chromosome transmission fidelity protein 18 [Arthroderma uncinatum]|uniref:chromosome transmission fidelity protein 18 n=1 Tax=Arthroderma uncinatum TaxID=74035 RepID=UPI00144A7FA7|nr:chromosome transmission fidelity protein 18 [Arthroderma uncinatum]KAF3482780.1 chromosome transmission fidelity protein 18 [Arthroderma uncinatum]
MSPTDHAKRKFDGGPATEIPKRVKTGPFVMDDDDDEDGEDNGVFQSDSKPDLLFQGLNDEAQPQSRLETFNNIWKSNAGLPNDTSTNLPKVTEQYTSVPIKTCSGKIKYVRRRTRQENISYERLIAERSATAPGKATRSYYGIDIHKLIDEAKVLAPSAPTVVPSIETPVLAPGATRAAHRLWTEKYRARSFKDLIGDDRTHRTVLRWLKAWDPIVFPGLTKPKAKKGSLANEPEERTHRKILLLTGPPGLGKTTLAHVCAKQVGYEVLEINASDERSRTVVTGRIKDAVGTENVKGVTVIEDGRVVRKPGKPVCVIIDEVDGVVSGSGGGGEGGFMKALIDLVQLDQKNSAKSNADGHVAAKKNKKKGDKFRLLRPLILICNDVYHPSLRPLRQASIAEIIHVRRVPFDQVVQRTKNIFEKEGIQCDGDGVRKLCEVTWGVSGARNQALSRGTGEGDIRGILVEAEWVAHKLRYDGFTSSTRLTKLWLERHILSEHSGNGLSRGLGRGGAKEIVSRVFLDGAGFPHDRQDNQGFQDPSSKEKSKAPVGVAELRKRAAINRLREMIDASGEYDRCATECFLTYPNQTFQDDTLLSKPNAAYDWLCFHDLISSKVFSNQDWELNPYLSQATIAFHHLFASSHKSGDGSKMDIDNDGEDEHPFAGPRADFAAFEAEKQNRAILVEFQSSLSAPLNRTFHSAETVVTELVPSLTRMLAPDIKPTLVGNSGGQGAVASVRKDSERTLLKAAVGIMHALGVTFEKTKLETEAGGHGGFIYRMEPSLDSLNSYSKVKGTAFASGSTSAPVRYAVRQALDQEYRKSLIRKQSEAQHSRVGGPPRSARSSNDMDGAKDSKDMQAKAGRSTGPKRDFFGRVIPERPAGRPSDTGKAGQGTGRNANSGDAGKKSKTAWISYHEGFSNAVRKKITMAELLSGL